MQVGEEGGQLAKPVCRDGGMRHNRIHRGARRRRRKCAGRRAESRGGITSEDGDAMERQEEVPTLAREFFGEHNAGEPSPALRWPEIRWTCSIWASHGCSCDRIIRPLQKQLLLSVACTHIFFSFCFRLNSSSERMPNSD